MSVMSSRKDTESFASVVEALRDIVEPNRLAMTERSLAAQITSILHQHRNELTSYSAPEPLTVAERDALLAVGVDPDVASAPSEILLGGAISYAALVGTALPIEEAATLIGVTPGRLRQRLAEGGLLGVRAEDGRSWRIPVFQFSDHKELPGLKTVLRAIGKDVHPLEIAAFFNSSQPDLEASDGGAMTPSAWLWAGGDPAVVARLAKDL